MERPWVDRELVVARLDAEQVEGAVGERGEPATLAAAPIGEHQRHATGRPSGRVHDPSFHDTGPDEWDVEAAKPVRPEHDARRAGRRDEERESIESESTVT